MSDLELKELFDFLNEDETTLPVNSSFKTSIKKILEQKKEPYLTRKQVAHLLQISLPTLHQYTKQGLLNSYRIGSKVRYKTSEIDEALKSRNFSLTKSGGNHGA